MLAFGRSGMDTGAEDPAHQQALDDHEGPIGSPDLSAWLAMATEGLCDEAKEQIATDITRNFAESYRLAVKDGHPEAKALNRALLNLGDPDEAKKRLRRAHLTKHEAAVIERLGRLTLWRLEKVFFVPALFLVLLIVWDRHSLLLAAAAAYVALLLAATAWGRFFAARGNVSTALVGVLVAYVMIVVMVVVTIHVAIPELLRRAYGNVLIVGLLLINLNAIFVDAIVYTSIIVRLSRRGRPAV
jgi:hypothetical protein